MTEISRVVDKTRWRENPYFYNVREYPGAFVNGSDEDFSYFNLNPHGWVGQKDQLFQVLKFVDNAASDKELMDVITAMKIKRGTPFLESKDVAAIINERTGLRYFALEKRITVLEFVKSWLNLGSRWCGWIIVRFGKTVELFNTGDCRFYGCHPILWKDKVSGYWVYEENKDERKEQ